jgi:hypothetical protein
MQVEALEHPDPLPSKLVALLRKESHRVPITRLTTTVQLGALDALDRLAVPKDGADLIGASGVNTTSVGPRQGDSRAAQVSSAVPPLPCMTSARGAPGYSDAGWMTSASPRALGPGEGGAPISRGNALRRTCRYRARGSPQGPSGR